MVARSEIDEGRKMEVEQLRGILTKMVQPQVEVVTHVYGANVQPVVKARARHGSSRHMRSAATRKERSRAS